MFKKWRRGRDSNPRRPCDLNGFQGRRFQPLTHLSIKNLNLSFTSGWCPGPDSNRHGKSSRGILSPLRLPIPPPGHCEVKVYLKLLKLPLNGGATRIRTGDQGFAGPCLSHLAMAPDKSKALNLWSGLRDSNPRPPPWQGGALAS